MQQDALWFHLWLKLKVAECILKKLTGSFLLFTNKSFLIAEPILKMYYMCYFILSQQFIDYHFLTVTQKC